jgi:hypothetical protein
MVKRCNFARHRVMAMAIRSDVLGGILGAVLAKLKSDFGLAPASSEPELAKLSVQRAQDLLARTEREMQAATAKAQAARRRADKLQVQLAQSPNSGEPAQLEFELQQAHAFSEHARQLFKVHSRIKSALPSSNPKTAPQPEPKP